VRKSDCFIKGHISRATCIVGIAVLFAGACFGKSANKPLIYGMPDRYL